MRDKRKYRGAGDLRHHVAIEQKSVVRDAFGGMRDTWSTFANAWAKITPLKSSEVFASAKENAALTHRIVIRYVPGIKPDMRIAFGERHFEIEAPRNYREKNEYLELLAREVVL